MAEPEARIGGEQPHLTDLFTTGKIFTVVYPDKPEIEVWVTRPSTPQNTKAQRASRVERAPRFRELTDPDHDESMALDVSINEYTKEELVDALLDRGRRTSEQQAYNEVLYAKEKKDNEGKGTGKTDFGSYWGPDGSQYMELLDALIKRMEEINDFNTEARAGGADEIDVVSDEEMVRLNSIQAEFETQIKNRVTELDHEERNEIARHGIDKLRRDLRKLLVEAECDVIWYSEFKRQMIYYAVRYPDKHGVLYFKNPDQFEDLPEDVQQQIYSAYEEIDRGAEQTKNLLTPLPS
jgi:hypothetical protein